MTASFTDVCSVVFLNMNGEERRTWPGWDAFASNPEAYMEVEFTALSLFMTATQKPLQAWEKLSSAEKVQYYQSAAQQHYTVQFAQEKI